MRTRIIGLALSLCLLLTACGGKEPDSRGQVSRLGRAAGLDENAVLLTVDGREVPAWRYLCWLAYTCDRVAQQYAAAGLALDWKAPVTGGTLADYARDQALADTALYAVVENWAAEYGCQAGTGEDAAPEESAFPDLEMEQQRELAAVGELYGALWTLYQDPDSPLAPPEEDLRAFAAERGCITLDRVLIPIGEDREAARQRVAEAFARLNGAVDQAAVFAELAAVGGDTAGARTVMPGDGTLDPALEAAAAALEEGECSGILESPEGFSILRRLPTDTTGLREEYFDHLLQTAAEQAEVEMSQAYETLEIPAFYRELKRLRSEMEGSSR